MVGPENPLDLPTPELSATSEEDDDNDEDEQHHTEQDVDENERVHKVGRIYDHAIINRKIRAFYDDWHTFEIMWYNTKLAEYRVLYEDSSAG